MIEQWKQVIGYEGKYEVSNIGNVRSVDRLVIDSNNVTLHYKSKLLKPSKNKYGYLQVVLSYNCNCKTYCVHSLVAKTFIDNLNNKPTVNHIDGNKLNNSITNLEWATKSEQAIHSLKNNLRKMPNNWIGKFGSNHGASKKVLQYSIDNVLIQEHGSIIEASKITKINAGMISRVCKGEKLTAGGYIWKHKEIEININNIVTIS